MASKSRRLALPTSPAHPPLVAPVGAQPHAWPGWESFSPEPRQLPNTPCSPDPSDADSDALIIYAASTQDGGGVGDDGRRDVDGSGGAGSRDDGGGVGYGGERRHGPARRGPQVGTVALLAVAMCLGVCLVGLFGFLPIYFIGFRDVSAAVQMAQRQAVASMVASASTSVSRLPNIIKFVLAAYMSSFEGALMCTRPDTTETLFYMANVVGQERYRDFITFITGVHAVHDHEWFIGVSTALKNVTLAAGEGAGLEPATLYAVDDMTHNYAKPRQVAYHFAERVMDYVNMRNKSVPAHHHLSAAEVRNMSVEASQDMIASSLVPSEVWVPWNYSNRFAYFSLLVPLSLPAEYGICTSFVEGSLRSEYIARIVREHFRYAIRQHGCYMMADLARDLVVVNSWNQSFVDSSTHVPSYVPFRVSEVEHPLMLAAVDVLAQQAGLRTVAERITDMQNEELTFKYRGKTAVLRVSPIRAPHGIDLMFLSVTLQSDFFTNIDRTMRALMYTMVAAVLATAVVSYVVAVYLRCAIRQLTVALRASSRLQFTTDIGCKDAPHSHIIELEDVEAAYGRVQQQLMTLKTVLPCALLINEDEEALNNADGDDDGGQYDNDGERNRIGGVSFAYHSSSSNVHHKPGSGDGGSSDRDGEESGSLQGRTRSSNGVSAVRSEEADSDSSASAPPPHRAGAAEEKWLSSIEGSNGKAKESAETYFNREQTTDHDATRVSRRWQQNVVLNTKVFHEKVNDFRKRYCTMVWICHYYTAGIDEAALESFLQIVYDAAMEFKGCIQSLRPDYVVVTFNAHTSLPLHAKLGCEMALAIRRRMAPSSQHAITTVVDTNNFYVGTCGSETGLKSRAVFDLMHFLSIDQLMRSKNYHQVLVTQSTAKHLESHETVPLDVLLVPFHEAPYTLYELREASGGNIAEMQRTAELFRSGFQRMRIGDYVHALKFFTRVDSADAAAQRLKLLCMKNILEGNKDSYLSRVRLPKLRILSRVVHLRNTSNLHLYAVRMWKQAQIGGFFCPGPFMPAAASEVEEGARERAEFERSLQDDRYDRNGGGTAIRTGTSASSLTPASSSSVTAPSPDRLTRQWGLEGTEESSRSNVLSPDEREGALIEWIDFHSASDTDDLEDPQGRGAASPTSATDSVPLCLLDSNGEKWNRALKADHAGHGSVVYQAMADDGVQVAIKFLPKKNRSIPEARLYNEIMVMSKLKHLNIVRYISYVWTAAHIGIVMEYAPGGSLREVIDGFGALPESLVRRYMVDILHGLAYLHRGGITHGDVKPHNILLGADGVCKLSDFGSTVCEATDLARSNGMLEFRGTAVYTSPEVAAGQLPTAASDIYSLGISFLEMLMGRLPWRWTDPRSHAKHGDCLTVREVAFVQAVGRGEIKPVISKHLSAAAQEFAQACCRPSPAERPTVSQLLSLRFVL